VHDFKEPTELKGQSINSHKWVATLTIMKINTYNKLHRLFIYTNIPCLNLMDLKSLDSYVCLFFRAVNESHLRN